VRTSAIGTITTIPESVVTDKKANLISSVKTTDAYRFVTLQVLKGTSICKAERLQANTVHMILLKTAKG
jgi:hypothetical protein